MQAYANKGIKEIIAEFPKIGEILEEYGIGCGPCTVGICQLKDILDIHKMPKVTEEELLHRMEAVFYPERDISITPKTIQPDKIFTDLTYSEPMQILVDEHTLIKRWLAQIPAVVNTLDLKNQETHRVIETGIDLIRSYADKRHHGKEEDILFTYFDDTSDIFQVIYQDHRHARALVKEMINAGKKENSEKMKANLLKYAGLLTEHIRKEDEILFPWLDKRLTETQKDELLARFNKADADLAIDPHKYESFISRLEQQEVNR